VVVEGRAHELVSAQTPNSVIVGKLRAIRPDRIVLGGGVRILLPAHVPIDGLEVGTSLTVVVQQEDEQLVAESVGRARMTSVAGNSPSRSARGFGGFGGGACGGWSQAAAVNSSPTSAVNVMGRAGITALLASPARPLARSSARLVTCRPTMTMRL